MIYHFLSGVMYTWFWSLKVHPRRKRRGSNLITTADSEAIIGVTAESTNRVLEGWHCNLLVRKFYLSPRALRHLQTYLGQGDGESIHSGKTYKGLHTLSNPTNLNSKFFNFFFFKQVVLVMHPILICEFLFYKIHALILGRTALPPTQINNWNR